MMPARSRRRLLGLLGSLTLTACAPLARRPAPAAVPAPEGQWQGRFSLRVERLASAEIQNGRTDSAQGNFALSSRGGQVVLDLASPLGQTLARIESDLRGAALVLADGRRIEAADAQSLLEQLLGWRLPVDRLPAALAALAGEDDALLRAARVAAVLGADWSARIEALDEGRQRLGLQWDGWSQGVSKLALTLIIDPPPRVSTDLQR